MFWDTQITAIILIKNSLFSYLLFVMRQKIIMACSHLAETTAASLSSSFDRFTAKAAPIVASS
jgi:hypothetical protein